MHVHGATVILFCSVCECGYAGFFFFCSFDFAYILMYFLLFACVLFACLIPFVCMCLTNVRACVPVCVRVPDYVH